MAPDLVLGNKTDIVVCREDTEGMVTVGSDHSAKGAVCIDHYHGHSHSHFPGENSSSW